MVTLDNYNIEQPITLAVDQSLFSDDLTRELSRSGYHLLKIDVEADFAELLSSTSIDAIIASPNFPLNHIFDSIPLPKRSELLLLIVPDEEHNAISQDVLGFVDAILPANPTYLGHQLRTLLHLRKENLLLQQEIVNHKRKNTEIEVLKNAIVRNVSHELRTPLLHVKSAVSLIAEDDANPKLIKYAENATAKLESLVQNITMLGHSLDINPQIIIIREIIDYAKRNLARIWTRRGETDRIRFDIEPNLPPLIADKQGMSIVMQLLMDNALKFGKDNPVDVSAHKDDDKIRISVRDYGIGIAQDKLPDIFDTFYQIDNSSTRRYGGAGVGLALVKLILDYHDAKIYVETELGEGSTFWFSIPYRKIEDIE